MGVSYHPESTTHETPFNLVYGTDALLPIELRNCSYGKIAIPINDEQGVRGNLDVLEEGRQLARVTSEATKRRVEKRYKSKVKPRDFQENDLVLRRAHAVEIEDKLSPKWIGPFRIQKVLLGGAYKLKTLDEAIIPRSWNAANLRFYFS